jgi:hypothetical protein
VDCFTVREALGRQDLSGLNLTIVGDIKHSLLTEAQFLVSLGVVEAGKWRLCNGQTCVGTNYAAITGATNVPDLVGRFLRMTGGAAAALNTSQADSTKRPNTVFTGSTNTTGNHTHNSDGPAQYTPYGGNARVAWEGISQNRATSAAGNHSHTITIDGGGDAETRPKNYGVNFFIKVNA